jgi:hypothetical protein
MGTVPEESEPEKNSAVTTIFPWRYCLLNWLLIHLAPVVFPVCLHWWQRLFLATSPFWVGVTVSVAIMLLAYHAFVFYMLRWWIRRPLTWMAAFIWPGLVLSGLCFCGGLPWLAARNQLTENGLVYPSRARGIKVCIGPCFQAFIRFQADRADIESFLGASPHLRDLKCTVVPASQASIASLVDPNVVGRYDWQKWDPRPAFHPPSWYDKPFNGPCRVYVDQGFELIFEEQSDTVFIRVPVPN